MLGNLQHITGHLPIPPDFLGRRSADVTSAWLRSPQAGVKNTLNASSEQLEGPHPNIRTIPDILAYSARNYLPDQRAFGYRDVIERHHETKKFSLFIDGREISETRRWTLLEMSDYRYITYTQFADAVVEARNGLLALGIGKEDVVNIYAYTSPTWQLMNHACASISVPMATTFDAVRVDDLVHSLAEPKCVAVFTHTDLLPTLSLAVERTPALKHIIYDGLRSASCLKAIARTRSDITLTHIDDLRARGRSQNKARMESVAHQRRPSRDTLACIMYTPGSSGSLPKGAMLTHGNLLAAVTSVNAMFAPHIAAGDVYLAYRSLAGAEEYVVQLCALYAGVTVGCARAQTLTDAGVKRCANDLAALRPHIMLGSPVVWEDMRKAIVGNLNVGGTVRRTMFGVAMEASRKGVPVLGGLGENMVLNRVRESTGGRLKLLLNTGEAVCKETQEFLSVAIAPMVQGYIITEAAGMCTLLPLEHSPSGSVGFPCPSVEVKLDYKFSKSKQPTGDICIRGTSVFKGYYKRPDLNLNPMVFTEDGWFRTGDIGQWNADNTLSIIDRKQNLVRLQNGQVISLEKLESIYRSSDLVSNLCVIAKPGAPYPIAVLTIHQVNLRHIISCSFDAAISRLDGAATSTLATCPYVRHLLLNSCIDAGVKNGLRGAEMLHAVVVAREEWTAENGLLTPAMKVDRARIAAFYEEKINAALNS